MKAILFSDLHLGLQSDSEKFHKISLDFAKWMANEARYRSIKTIICCGDVFHNRKSIGLATIKAAYEFFNTLKDFDIRIITGNHDCLYLENSEVHSISLLKNWKNISVYDVPYYEIIDGHNVGFIPWGVTVNNMEKCDIMFGHYEITGFQMGPNAFCEDGMTATNLLKKSPTIFSGHFHKPQINKYKEGEIVYIGSPFQHNWGEAGQDKYIYELDFKTKNYEKITNTISPIHVEIKDKSDIDKAKGNIVRIISNPDDSEFIKAIDSVSTISVDVILNDSTLEKAAEIIKDFKGVDPIEGAEEICKTMEGMDDKTRKSVLSKIKHIHQMVS